MQFASIQDTRSIEKEMRWEERDIPKTLFEMLTKTTEQFGNKNAVTFQLLSGPSDKAETLTWNMLHEKTAQTANLFRSLGIGPNDVVAFILPNCNETVLTLLGGMVAGIVNPINPLLEPDQMGAILRETNARLVVTLKSFPKTEVAQNAAKAVELAPNVETVLEIDLNRYLTPPKSWLVTIIRPRNEIAHNAVVLNFNEVLNRQNKTLNFEDVQEDRVAALFHTGGTTGMPKVAQHKYSGIMYNAWLGVRLLMNEDENVICPLPLFHVLAAHVVLMGCISSGAHVIFPTPAGYRGDGVFDNFWKLVERWKITFIFAVPTAISALMQRPVNANIGSVKTAFSGSAPLPIELFNRFEKATGVNIIEGYGLTEATVLVSGNPVDGEKKIGSVGIRFPHTEIKIFRFERGAGIECKANEIGEICVASPGVWPGHTYTEVEKNRELYHDERFLRTGDLGRIDEDEYLWITGRAKDLIIRGGHNIDPALIEETLLGNKAVAFAGAIGQPDVELGELPCAYVELVSGAKVTAKELNAYCQKYIPERAAFPRYIELVDELPKTAVGKVFKPELRKRAIKRVFNETLAEAKLQARVESVIDDKNRGLVAQISIEDTEEKIQAVVGQFVYPWERK